MRVLLVSNDLIAGHLAFLLKKEGCDVKLHIDTKQQKKNFHNLVEKTNNWEKELKWVGKDGLIIFDYVGYGKIQETLRKKGYSVFGGSMLSDKLESDREWSQKIFKKYGLDTLKTLNFSTIESALKFVRHNTGPWVIKQNGLASKSINYVGEFEDNRDVISVLENYLKNHKNKLGKITLQKRAYGVEVGVGRYFDGKNWVGPIEINVEHKKMFPGDIGPTTSEMGTLAWYDSDEQNPIFCKTLAKLKPFLEKIDFRGDIDIGCMANEKGIFTLEATPRLGSPIIHLHSELHRSPWHKFLKAVSDQKKFDLEWKSGFGIVVMACVPPYPYKEKMLGVSSYGVEVFFDDSIINNQFDHVHFEEISRKKTKNGSYKYYISDHRGCILYVTGIANSISKARAKTAKILKKIHIPKMFYRNDIGVSFETTGLKKLIEWSYLKPKINK